MSEGITVYSSTGTPRIFNESWSMRYYNNYSIVVNPSSFVDIPISGFTDRWGVVNLIIQPASGTDVSLAGKCEVTLNNGYIRLRNYGSFIGMSFTFDILKAS